MEGTGCKRNVGDETISSLMTSNPLRILVTGAGGLLGSELSGALTERGHAVVAMLHHSTAMCVRSRGCRVELNRPRNDQPRAHRDDT